MHDHPPESTSGIDCTGRIHALFLRPGSRIPVRAVERATVVTDRGLEGDHAVGGRRQVTLLDLGRWRDACLEAGLDLDPAVRRANIVVDGLDLTVRRGARLVLGEPGTDSIEIEVVGETRPCELLDDAIPRTRIGGPGISTALRQDARGGIFGRIVRGGTVAVGDPVRWQRD